VVCPFTVCERTAGSVQADADFAGKTKSGG
jgi:hypothetical protein